MNDKKANIDPFYYATPILTNYEVFKLIILFPLAIIRITLFITCLITIAIISNIVMLGHHDNKPLNKWRLKYIPVIKCIIRIGSNHDI